MNFNIETSIEILERTPGTVGNLLKGISEDWIRNNEGGNTWSPYDVVGHLIYGEKTDWIVRAQIILGSSDNKTFEPYDRFAQMREDQNQPIGVLIDQFAELRRRNITELRTFNITEFELIKSGIHPELGEVTLQQLIAAWVVHDLGHIVQISRVMAKQYINEVGPWSNYLTVLER